MARSQLVLPPLLGVRSPSRFGDTGGLRPRRARRDRLEVPCAHASNPRWQTAAAAGLLALATVESLHAPIPYRPLTPDEWYPPIYQRARDGAARADRRAPAAATAGSSTRTPGTCWRQPGTGGRSSTASADSFPAAYAVAARRATGDLPVRRCSRTTCSRSACRR